MTITIGINGFGRIGRCTLRHIAESARTDVKVINLWELIKSHTVDTVITVLTVSYCA